jgi:hypothetical protein
MALVASRDARRAPTVALRVVHAPLDVLARVTASAQRVIMQDHREALYQGLVEMVVTVVIITKQFISRIAPVVVVVVTYLNCVS